MMKNMKKVLAGFLAATMVMSMSVTAWADETPTGSSPENETYTDASSIDLSKVYKITNAGTSNPQETFTFTIANEDVSDSAYSSVTEIPTPTFNDDKSEITFAAGSATTEGLKENLTINLPNNYRSVGVYTYKITETPGATAGVTYDEPVYLKVTVIQQGDDMVRVAGLYRTDSDGTTKLANAKFENIYSAGDLKISKEVKGRLGDRTKYFEFKVKLEGESGKTYQDIVVSGGSYENNPQTVTIGTEATIYLKHDETITLSNIPYDVNYTVEETEDRDYDTTKATGDGNENYTAKIDTNEETVAFTNTKKGDSDWTPDTGILLDSAPYVLLLALAGAGAAVVVSKKRRDEF